MNLQSSAGVFLIAVSMSLVLTSCSRVAAKTDSIVGDRVPVRAVRAVFGDVPLDVAAVGNVESADSVEVKARVAGQVERVVFQEGENVAKGQLLFTIDRDSLERQAVVQQAELARDAAMEQQARALVTRDAASQRQSKSEADVAVQLGKLGVISGQRVDQLAMARDTLNAGLRSDQAAVEAAEAARKADQARLAEMQLQLNFTQVTAPIDGRAGASMVRAGDIVGENGTTLVTLLQVTPIDVAFGIPEQMLAAVQQLNAQHSLRVEAGDGSNSSEQGRLVFIDNTVDRTTGMIQLKAVFPNSNGALWPGEFVHVRLRLRVDPSRILVPTACVQDGISGKYTWLLRSGRAMMTAVTVVRTYAPETGPELAVIGSGIHPGDLVVTQGQLRLTQGAHVLLLSAPRSATAESPAL